jgi:hypothetical protein
MNRIVLALALTVLLPGVALASNKRDAELALTEARSAVEAAERAGAEEHAAVDLRVAHEHLAQAGGEYDSRDWTDSVMASEKSKADASLAESRSRQHRAEATTAEVDATVRRLRQELGMQGG